MNVELVSSEDGGLLEDQLFGADDFVFGSENSLHSQQRLSQNTALTQR